MNFDKAIEESVVNLIKAVKFPTVQVDKTQIRRYRGECDALYGLVQTDFNPRGSYILAEVIENKYAFVTSSVNDVKVDAQVKIYVGNQGPDYITSRDRIGELKATLANALHNAIANDENGNPVCTLYVLSDQQIFVMKDHFIWNLILNAKTQLRSLGSPQRPQ